MKTTLTLIVMFFVFATTDNSIAQKRSSGNKTSSRQLAATPRYIDNRSHAASGASSFRFGAEVVLNKSIYDFKGYGNGEFCYAFYAVGDYSLNHQMGLIFKFGYDAKKASLQFQGINFENSIDYIVLQTQFRYNVDRLFVAVGPIAQFVTGKESIKASDNNGNMSTGEKEADVSTRLGIVLGAGYEIPVSNSIDFQPNIGYELMFTSPLKEDGATLNGLRLGVGLRFKM